MGERTDGSDEIIGPSMQAKEFIAILKWLYSFYEYGRNKSRGCKYRTIMKSIAMTSPWQTLSFTGIPEMCS